MITKLPIYTNASECAECGGVCCNRAPGQTLPSDWGDTPTEMRQRLLVALRSGNWAIDEFEGDPRPNKDELFQVFFVRPGIVGIDSVFHESHHGGRCKLLTDAGCSLEHDDRPTVCRMLEPDPRRADWGGLFDMRGCRYHGPSPTEVAIAWIPYQALVKSLGDRVSRERQRAARRTQPAETR